MKKRYYIPMFFTVILLLISACNSEDFLEKKPKDQLTEKTAFTSNANFKTYAWSLYANILPGYWDLSPIDREVGSDLMSFNMGLGSRRQIHELFDQRKIVPATSATWTNAFKNIRRVNLMLDNIDGSKLSDDQKNHWKGVGLFFRAFVYTKLIAFYGEVPWVSKAFAETDTSVLFGAKTPRNTLAKNILNDLIESEKIISSSGTGPNTINTDVVRALISRFGLYEGTWRKYHGLGGENEYLQACADASKKLLKAHPNLHDKYDEIFNSESLNGVKGILLYKAYEFGVVSGRWSHYNRSSVGHNDLTKKAADQYLFRNGKNVHTDSNFRAKEKDPYTEYRDRDYRFYFNTVPPFRVDTGGKNVRVETKDTDRGWKYHSDNKHMEYINLMKTLTNDKHKTLPTVNWTNLVVRTSPHFRAFNEGHGYNITITGYRFYKFYNRISTLQNKDSHDCPIFRMGEVMLNYAEAMYELGKFDQNVADLTINKLRKRGGVAALTLSAIPNDPTRDSDVDPKLWEIRRERGVEFLCEGLGRAFDIKRWKKLMEYGDDEKLGRWVKNSDYGNKLTIQGGAAEGYISPFGKPKGPLKHYYLEPIPSDEIVLNPKLKQNPGW